MTNREFAEIVTLLDKALEHAIGEMVYIKNDVENEPYIVIGYAVRQTTIMYMLSDPTGIVTILEDFQISKNRML